MNVFYFRKEKLEYHSSKLILEKFVESTAFTLYFSSKLPRSADMYIKIVFHIITFFFCFEYVDK